MNKNLWISFINCILKLLLQRDVKLYSNLINSLTIPIPNHTFLRSFSLPRLDLFKVGCTFVAVPLLTVFGLFSNSYAREVEPLVETGAIVAGNHIPVRDVVAETVGGLGPWTNSFHAITPRSNLTPTQIHRSSAVLSTRLSNLIQFLFVWKHYGWAKTAQKLTIFLKT